MKINMKRKLIIATFAIVSIASCSKKVDNTCKEYENRINSLQNELTIVGSELDSMILLHDYGFSFTN